MLSAAGLAWTLAILSDFALAAIGPVTTLTISNADISPDGFKRSYVEFHGFKATFSNQKSELLSPMVNFQALFSLAAKCVLCYVSRELVAEIAVRAITSS